MQQVKFPLSEGLCFSALAQCPQQWYESFYVLYKETTIQTNYTTVLGVGYRFQSPAGFPCLSQHWSAAGSLHVGVVGHQLQKHHHLSLLNTRWQQAAVRPLRKICRPPEKEYLSQIYKKNVDGLYSRKPRSQASPGRAAGRQT